MPLAALLVLALATAAPAQLLDLPMVKFDPALEWRSIRTEHFWIHYHRGLEPDARRLAVIAERVHQTLTPLTKWRPYFRTDIVLVDNMDDANGFSIPVPFNRVQLFLARPTMHESLNNYDNWLELLFTHEYTHTLNIDAVRGLPEASRYLLGRVCFPNAFLPYWATEGNAVYHESRDSRFGRVNSTYTDMVMRTEALHNTLASITAASHMPRRWPTGLVPYLYGGLFVQYLEDTRGRNRFADIFIENSYNLLPYSDNIIPFILPFIDTTAETVYRKTFRALWEDYRTHLSKKYEAQIASIRQAPVTRHALVSDSGHNTVLPRFSRDGGDLYYVRMTNYDKRALMRYSLKNATTATLARVNAPGDIAVGKSGAVYLADLELYRSFSLYSDVFRYTDGYRQMSRGLRAVSIDVSDDEHETVYVTAPGDRYSLVLADAALRERARIIDTSDLQISYARLSPDGGRIAFSFKDRSGNVDIAVYDRAAKAFTRITDDASIDLQPVWHPDGARIIFSSDRSGAYNLYEYRLATGELVRLTNLLGGALWPAVSPDGSGIAFSAYGKNGFDIALMPYPVASPPQKLPAKPMAPDYFLPPPSAPVRTSEPTEQPYTPLRSLFNPAWIPMLYSDEIYNDTYDAWLGAFTMGTDALYRHFYALAAAGAGTQQRAAVSAMYLYSGLYPNIMLQYNDDSLFYGHDGFPWRETNNFNVKRTMEKSGTVAVDVPFLSFYSSHDIVLAYTYQRTYTDWFLPPTDERHYTDDLARVRVAYLFSNASRYAWSVSPEDGRSVSLSYDFYHRGIGSDYSFSKARAEYAEYLPGIFRNHVTLLRLRGGAAFDNPDHLAPFNVGRFERGAQGGVASDDDLFGLRGYPAGLIYGNRTASAALEYRFPAVQPDCGFSTLPVLLKDVWLTVFGEYGNTWSGDPRLSDFRSSAGLELHVRITLGYTYDLRAYIGAARGFDRAGENQVYFGVGTFYEGAFKGSLRPFAALKD